MMTQTINKYYAIRHKSSGMFLDVAVLNRTHLREQFKKSKKKVPNLDFENDAWLLLDGVESLLSGKIGSFAFLSETKEKLRKSIRELTPSLRFSFNPYTQKYKQEQFVFDNSYEIVTISETITKTWRIKYV